MRIANLFAAVIISSAVAIPANAANFIVNAVINSATLQPSFLNVVDIDPISLEVGDTLDLTITFSGGPLTLNEGSPLWTGLLTTDAEGLITTTSTLTIIGGSANLVTSSGPLTQDNESVHVGNFFGNSAVQTAPGSITFTGLNQMMAFDADNIGAPRSYNQAFFYYESSAVAAVPEAASWAMLITGFGLVGAVARRRRIAIAA